ncbi:hypothetical protein [Microscilla marina]|uniref:Uncharacterized protein n=1 Tax=Microscilla marina ATCC 23134 TaxID=313606 RepID=A1ZEI9_MICM2|nr:hypothetical protein [Microscilla marina]EAY30941.1 hypothetical protein M23134_07348 [Microscilla marina ATCC 23134]
MNKNTFLQKIKKANSTSELNTKNPYDEKHKSSQYKEYYQKADAYMTGKSYLERRVVWYKLGKSFRLFYHPVSVVLALITAVLLATRHLDFKSLGVITTLLLLLTLVCLIIIFGALEWGKKEKATDVFYKRANGNEVPLIQWGYLSLFVISSLVVSAVGGALIGDSQIDQSKAIAAAETQKVQQIKKKNQPRLTQLSNTIAGLENLSVNAQLRRWGLTVKEQENLEAGKAEKVALEKKQLDEITQVKTKYEAATSTNDHYRTMGMGIGFSLVLLMELLTIYAYYFHSVFMKRVQEEGNEYDILNSKESTSDDPGSKPSPKQITEAIVAGILQVANAGSKAGLYPTGGVTLPDNHPSHSSIKTTASDINSDATVEAVKTPKADNAPVDSEDGVVSVTPDATVKPPETEDNSCTSQNSLNGIKTPVNKDVNTIKTGKNSHGSHTSQNSVKTPINEGMGTVKTPKKEDNSDGSYTSQNSLNGTHMLTGVVPVKTVSKHPKSKTRKATGVTGTPVKAGAKKTSKNGYYIPPECFDRYYQGRDRTDDPYRKLRWYEEVLPDLIKGVKYADILQKKYKVYDFCQDRYVVKHISDTTLRITLVKGLKSLADSE